MSLPNTPISLQMWVFWAVPLVQGRNHLGVCARSLRNDRWAKGECVVCVLGVLLHWKCRSQRSGWRTEASHPMQAAFLHCPWLCPAVRLISEEGVEVFHTAESLLIFLTVGEMPSHPPPLHPLSCLMFPNGFWESVQWGSRMSRWAWGSALHFSWGDVTQKFYAIKKKKGGRSRWLKEKACRQAGRGFKKKKKKPL